MIADVMKMPKMQKKNLNIMNLVGLISNLKDNHILKRGDEMKINKGNGDIE